MVQRRRQPVDRDPRPFQPPVHGRLDGIVASPLRQQRAVQIHPPEAFQILRHRDQPVILRHEEKLAPLFREVPPDLPFRDGFVVDRDPRFPGLPGDPRLGHIVLVVMIRVQGEDFMSFQKIFKAGQEYIRSEINDLHMFSRSLLSPMLYLFCVSSQPVPADNRLQNPEPFLKQ